MANSFIKAGQVVQAANLLLQREIVLPRLVSTDIQKQAFKYSLNDTVTMAIPAVRVANSRTMRSSTGLTATDLTETKVDVKLTDHVYDLLNITDEQLTLDIRDFTSQVLNPQMRAVAEGLENVIGDALAAATPNHADIAFAEATDDPYKVVLQARKALNDLNVPMNNRVLLVGSSVELALLDNDRISKAQNAGDAIASSALTDATIARVAGFQVVTSNAISANAAYAFHQSAIAFAAMAPALPDGAPMKASVSTDGFGLRFIRDYDPTNATGPVDRSLVDSFVGASSVEEGATPKNNRLVKIAFTPAP